LETSELIADKEHYMWRAEKLKIKICFTLVIVVASI
jgi:hypothetical protein